jgi:DNA-directed RNA polymerase specialized sigma24 family protein
MPTARTILRHLFMTFLVFFQGNYFSFSQNATFPTSDWTKKLSSKNFFSSGLQEIRTALKDKDASSVNSTFNELEKKGASSGIYFNPHLNVLKANWLNDAQGCSAKDSISQLYKKALNGAYEIDDDLLVSNISWRYGAYMFGCSEMEPAAMYCLYAAEIDEKIDRQIDAGQYQLLGDVLYNTRDYEKAIYYTSIAIKKQADTSAYGKNIIMSRWNTIALCWQKLGMYDSAFFYFSVAMKMAMETKNIIWKSIIGGNIGQVYFLQRKFALAKPLLESDYRVSKAFGELSSAANSLQWVARINLVEGKKDSALTEVKEAMQLVQRMANTASYFYYYANVCYATADVYRAIGNYDSADKYSQLYNRVHDSLERSAASGRLEIARIKLENIQNAVTIKNLHKEKETERLIRNFILAFIVMFAAIVILLLNRQRQKSIHQRQMALREKAAAESEVVAAREQLNMFKQNIIEKTDLIEKLQEEVRYKEANDEQLEIVNELSRQTILTEADWDKFKTLFEKIYPGFFAKLKEKAADITVAEQRMAALTRLHLTTKQIASMLGISVDSVHKTRQRLRQRLQLHVDINLEETIAHL